jgi:photosystem II stability/assembly factor-like uncharacterized protein
MRATILLSTILLLMLTTTILAQPGWFQVREDGSSILYSIDLYDANHITAVGSDGIILQSDDGGSSWRTLPSGTTDNLRRVRWHSPALGVILGNGGVVLKSTDGGASWQKLNTGIPDALYDVHFFDENNWMVVGRASLVLTTTDAGASWDVGDPDMNNYNEIAFRGDLGIIAGNKGTIMTTEDGGQRWRERTSGTSSELTSVSIGDDSTAIIVGANGTILRTQNKGRTWQKMTASIPISSYRMSGVHHLTRDRAVICGYFGVILWSTDAGLTWEPQESNTQQNLEGLAFIDEKIGVVSGSNGTILRTNTAGTLGVTHLADAVPAASAISDAWPHPLSQRAQAQVRIAVSHEGPAHFGVYDLLGRERVNLISRVLDAGTYAVQWNPSTLSNGVYLYRLESHGTVLVRKFVVVD